MTASSSLPDPGLFPLPELAVARHPAVILAPRQLRRWMSALPLANPARTAELLQQQLRLLVRDPQPGPRLATLLGLYLPPILQLLAIARERIQVDAEHALPMEPLERQLVDILQTLGDGYLRTFNEALLVERCPSPEDLYTATWAFEHALAIERLRYRPLADAGWQRLLRLFLCAERHGVAAKPCPPERRRDEDPETVRALFFRMLIVGLADPFHWRPSQLLAFMTWLGGRTGSLALSTEPAGSHPIPLDLGPASRPPGGRRPAAGPDTRYLLADDLLQMAAGVPALRAALLDLAEGRRAPELRRSPRHGSTRPYRILPGLRNVYQRLSELAGAGTAAVPADAWEARQLNQSKRGAAFVVANTVKPPLMIGAPVLAEVAGPGQSATAVGFAALIRRVVCVDEHRFEIGVEKLQGRIVPVKVAMVSGGRSYAEPYGLLLHTGQQSGLALLAPRAWYRPDDLVAVEGPATRYRLRMTHLEAVAQNLALMRVAPDND